MVFSFIIIFLESLTDSTTLYECVGEMIVLQGYIIFYITTFTCYIVLETYFSRTISKYITQNLVVTKDGLPVDLRPIVQRTLYSLTI
jgi:hypothetical protein